MRRYASASGKSALRDRAIGEGRIFASGTVGPDGLALYIAQDIPPWALTFVDELEAKCDALGRAPGIGTARPELGEGICMLPYGRYLIFHRLMNQVLRIERICGNDLEADGTAGR